MTTELRVSFNDAGQMSDLQEWLSKIKGVHATPVARPAEGNSQGTAWDFLSVACETSGPVVVALRALQKWLEARVTTIEVRVGSSVFKVHSADAADLLPKIEQAARALGAAGADSEPPQ
ncbi:effector-associated constant component EACC1 [Actinospica robiniae]|uniref:effector-associated constant component EACC1 n=1 Tax=Actinospica robiniae TaxID=304901 RepID=UPI0003FB7601|nr:hypothetical protein [Actinospica robiniae]